MRLNTIFVMRSTVNKILIRDFLQLCFWPKQFGKHGLSLHVLNAIFGSNQVGYYLSLWNAAYLQSMLTNAILREIRIDLSKSPISVSCIVKYLTIIYVKEKLMSLEVQNF